LRYGARAILDRVTSTADCDRQTRRAEEINRDVFTLLQGIGERPFFLFVNYMDAHTPYMPPPPYDTRFAGHDRRLSPEAADEVSRLVLRQKRHLTEGERRWITAQYDGGIAYMDHHIGRLVERLRSLGRYDNTLIIITSDHGEAFGERDLMEHGVSVYQDQVRIPLLVKYPNSRERAEVDGLASHVDLMPTVLDVLGYPEPAERHGISLRRAKARESGYVVSESYRNPWLIDLGRRFDRLEHALFLGNMKLVTSTAGKRELYDLAGDPTEQRNLYWAGDVTTEKLQSALERWLKAVAPYSGSSVQPDEETLQRLKSLGYVQ
ncbi:MAG: sulfatase-like hydrolase/transferase, partial [Acidobacteria bacterium]|nr:sulfatase-like hydrolase/transferase [Acidobacteriota bacterium]